MSNGLAVYTNLDAVNAIEKLGELIASGGLYGCKNKGAGATLVLMAETEKVPIGEMRKRYHIMNGKQGSRILMRAEYMLAEFRRLGGQYTWIDEGDNGEQAVLHVKHLTNDRQVKFTIEDAKKQGLVKGDSNWTKNPGAMLRARASSKAIIMVCPEVLAGFAGEGETESEVEIEVGSEPSQKPSVAAPPAAVENAQITPPADASQGDVVDAKSVVKKATGEQIKRLMELFDAMSIDPTIQLKAITSTGARDMGDLSSEGAGEIIAKLETALSQHQAEKNAASELSTGACDEGQQANLKSLIQRVAQGPGGAEIPARLQTHLKSQGTPLFADLSASDADRLAAALQSDKPESFLELTFEGHSKNE